MVESVALLAIACEYFWMFAGNDLPMFERGVMIGRIFVCVCCFLG